MKIRKWKVELIIAGVLLCVAGSIWWYVSTNDERKADAQYEQFVKFANRQQVEIAIIRQSAELQQLRSAIQQATKNQQRTALSQNPTIVQPPVIANPKDVEIE